MGVNKIAAFKLRSAMRLFLPLVLILQLSLSGIASFSHVSDLLSFESFDHEASSLQHFYVDDIEDKSINLDPDPLTFYDLTAKKFVQASFETPLNSGRSKTHSRSPPIS